MKIGQSKECLKCARVKVWVSMADENLMIASVLNCLFAIAAYSHQLKIWKKHVPGRDNVVFLNMNFLSLSLSEFFFFFLKTSENMKHLGLFLGLLMFSVIILLKELMGYFCS